MFNLKTHLVHRIAVDLGSSRSRLWIEGRGLVLDAPTCLALDGRRTVLAVGSDAAEMEERTGEGVRVVWPVRGGAVADAEALLALLKVWLKPFWRPLLLTQPTILVSVPVGSTADNRRQLRATFGSLGAGEVITVAQSLAAAIGTGVPIADASGSYVLHLGAGTVEAGVVSLGSIREWHQSPLAGDYLIGQVALQLESQLGLLASRSTQASLLHTVFSCFPESDRSASILAKQAKTGQPVEQPVDAGVFAPIVQSLLEQYVELVTQVLEASPAALLVDLLDKGLLLSGGLAQLHGLDTALSHALQVPVGVVEEPDMVVIRGMGQLLANLDTVRQSLGYHHETSQI